QVPEGDVLAQPPVDQVDVAEDQLGQRLLGVPPGRGAVGGQELPPPVQEVVGRLVQILAVGSDRLPTPTPSLPPDLYHDLGVRVEQREGEARRGRRRGRRPGGGETRSGTGRSVGTNPRRRVEQREGEARRGRRRGRRPGGGETRS